MESILWTQRYNSLGQARTRPPLPRPTSLPQNGQLLYLHGRVFPQPDLFPSAWLLKVCPPVAVALVRGSPPCTATRHTCRVQLTQSRSSSSSGSHCFNKQFSPSSAHWHVHALLSSWHSRDS